jgi:integrase
MRIYKQKNSPKWWFDWRDQNGKRYRRSSGTTDHKLAKALAAKLEQELFLEENFGKKPDVPFAEALIRYARAHKRDYPKHFKTSTRYRLKMISEWFHGFNVSEITSAVIQEYIDERLDEVKLATAQKDAATLKAILNKAYREELIEKVPSFPKIRWQKGRCRWLSDEEEELLVWNAAPHIVPLIRFAVDTGGRLSELLQLDWRNVDLDRKSVVFLDTKNGEDRTVRLCDRSCAVLASIGPKSSGPVFTYKGKSVKTVKTAFNNARKKAGLEDVRFHDLRHTFASRLAQGGLPLYNIMSMTGHKSLEMVQCYAHLAPDYQEGAMDVLNSRRHNLGIAAVLETAKLRLSH